MILGCKIRKTTHDRVQGWVGLNQRGGKKYFMEEPGQKGVDQVLRGARAVTLDETAVLGPQW